MDWLDLVLKGVPHAWKWSKGFFQNKNVIILGAGGVGKSTMGDLLARSMSILSIRTEYEESIDTDTYKVKGDFKATVFVVAGQAHRREATWREPLEDIQNGTVDGVILLNANGFHSIGPLGLQGQGPYARLKSEGREDHFLEEHLKSKREEELVVLKYIAPHLKARSEKKIWMLSVITKEDLWFDNHDDVRQHYESGEYSDVVQDVYRSLGANMFRHELVTMSMLITDFVTGRGEELARTSQSYDQAKQVESAKRFFNTITSLN